MARKIIVVENDIFKIFTRSTGDVAGVFEYDGEVGYFYLYDLRMEKGKQIAGAIYVYARSENSDLRGSDISIKWNNSQEIVGLCIEGCLWAAFDRHGKKHGGRYKRGQLPEVPAEILATFQQA